MVLMLSNWLPELLVKDDLAWMWAVFLLISSRTTYICREVFLPIKWVKLVQYLNKSLTHRHSNDHRCVSLGAVLARQCAASGSESWGCGRDPSDSPRKSILLSPWIGRCRTKVDVLSSWSLPGGLIRPSAIGKTNSPCLGNITSFALSLFE